MTDDHDYHPAPYIDGFGSASTLHELNPEPAKPKKIRKIGFKFPNAKAKPIPKSTTR